MKSVEIYHKKVQNCLDAILENEQENIARAADLLVEAVKKDRLIHVIGTGGHSSMAAEEMLCRAGGLVPVNPLLEQGYNLAHGAFRSSMVERLPGYAKSLLEYYQVEKDAVLIVVNSYGINSLTIDTVIEAKKIGAKVIAVTSPESSRAVPKNHPARHPSKQNLCRLDIDVLIDCRMPAGDAVVEFRNYKQKIAPVSTILNSFVLNSLVACTVEKLLAQNIEPPVWEDANLSSENRTNAKYWEEYFDKIKHL